MYKGLLGEKYNVVVDAKKTLMWDENTIDGLSIIMLLSEEVSVEYLSYLKALNISYIVVSKAKIDLKKAMNILLTEFNIKSIGVVSGGNINVAFLDNNLLDEIIILIGPGIDG